MCVSCQTGRPIPEADHNELAELILDAGYTPKYRALQQIESFCSVTERVSFVAPTYEEFLRVVGPDGPDFDWLVYPVPDGLICIHIRY